MVPVGLGGCRGCLSGWRGWGGAEGKWSWLCFVQGSTAYFGPEDSATGSSSATPELCVPEAPVWARCTGFARRGSFRRALLVRVGVKGADPWKPSEMTPNMAVSLAAPRLEVKVTGLSSVRGLNPPSLCPMGSGLTASGG